MPPRRRWGGSASEDEADAELNAPRVVILCGGVNLSETGCLGALRRRHGHVRRREVGVIKGVEGLCPELDQLALGDHGVLDYGQVDIVGPLPA